MEIQRPKYLQELIDRKHNGMVKVITGLRRVGKSYLLFSIFYHYLQKSGIRDDHILRLELDDRKNRKYLDPDILLAYIEEKITDENMYYILLDEIQYLPEFESVLNSLLHKNNLDIYVTGSNSRFLSKDVITEFRGRGDEIHLYPLSFTEFVSAFQGSINEAWKEYYTYGGLPYILTRKTEAQKMQYLSLLFEETYIKDIISRNKINSDEVLETLINILASQTGSLTNPKRIADTYKSLEQNPTSPQTIKKYIEYLKDAFLITEAMRFDVKGRRYIASPLKYYFEDTGLRNARLHFRQQEENHIMENIIFNELRLRGFAVDVGVVEKSVLNVSGTSSRRQYEVDFVANLGSRRYYIQSAFSLGSGEKIEQEKKSLCSIDDSFKKIIIVRDDIKLKRDEDGIMTMSIFDFLLNENSLDW